jgi:2-polyprenyl-3-methyl-5-hydroxy-6-metoxy-1,4-benzoquinol methylase
MKRTYISWGDFIDLYFKIKARGIGFLKKKIGASVNSRAISKWNEKEMDTNFWVIPEVLQRWNEKSTGNPDLSYEAYFTQKYLADKSNLHLLSVGCGSGLRERNFAVFPNFATIEGIDFAEAQVYEASLHAKKENPDQIYYHTGDFLQHLFNREQYDVILFNSSLHHFNHIETLITNRVIPLLKPEGYLIIFEFVGPDRLQWKKEQLDFANNLLRQIPKKYKRRYNSYAIKRKIYRPGWLRMILNDPSEAIASTTILPAIHKHFKIVEEKKIGWDITHILFKDIAHNFLSRDEETKNWIRYIFDKEDKYLKSTGNSDAVFGIYQLY